MASALLGMGADYYLWRKLTPGLYLSAADCCRRTLRQLTGTGFWVSVTQVGTILTLGIDLLVVNLVLGADAAGRYAPLLQWSAMLRSVAGISAGIFGPTIIALFVREDRRALSEYTCNAIAFVGLIMALPIGLLAGFAEPMLRILLGPSFAPLSPLFQLMLLPLSINLAILPMFSLNLAANKIRQPALLTLLMGGANVILAVFLAQRFGMYGVAAAGVMLLTLKNAAYMPVYTARCIDQPAGIFYGPIARVLCATVVLTLAGWMVSRWLPLGSWLALLSAMGTVTILFMALTYLFLLRPSERARITTMVRSLDKLRTAIAKK